jgi:predicted GIY-YIG superfamily endonuclease
MSEVFGPDEVREQETCAQIQPRQFKRCKVCDPFRKASDCRPCFVYVVGNRDGSGAVKVGMSFKPTQRLAQHRKMTGRDLTVHHKTEMSCEYRALDAEDRALDHLARYRTQGDWFACSIDTAISAVIKGARR